MAERKNSHISGALAALLNSGDVKPVIINNSDEKRYSKPNNLSNYLANQTEQLEPTVYTVHEISPDLIINWKLHDRSEIDLGDIEELANSMVTIGQKQPCIVRLYHGSDFKYELIIGERRWRAAKLRNIDLKVIIENLNDHDAALCQVIENERREDLCDYSKGMNYAQLIGQNIVSQKELESVLNKTKVEITRLLSFSHVPTKIWETIGDVRKISARTASEIRAMVQHKTLGHQYTNAIIQLAEQLKTGKLGARNLRSAADKLANNITYPCLTKEIMSLSGRHLFSWRRDSNGNLSVSFPKSIREIIDKEQLEHVIKETIETQIQQLDKKV